MENYVEQFRKNISAQIDAKETINLILNPDLNHSSSINKARTLLFETITFMDLYKAMNYKKATTSLTEKDFLLMPIVDSIIETNHIHELILIQPGILPILLESSYNFHKATILEKISQIKALNSEDRNFLLELTPCFQQDLDTYDGNIKIETLYDYYQDIKKFYKDQKMIFMLESIIDQMVGFLKNLHHYDEENFIQMVFSLSIIDYKYASCLLKNDKYPSVANGKNKAIFRVNIFEEGREKDILDYALLDEYYLSELIDMYLMTRSLYPSEKIYELEYKHIDIKAKEKVKKIEERLKKYGK